MQRKNKYYLITSILIVIGWGIWLLIHPLLQKSSQPKNQGMIFGVIEKVYDGDTFEVRTSEGKLEKVRLLGINTPEVTGPYRKSECYGNEASQFMKQLLPDGSRVTIVAEGASFTYDQYHRILGYAYQGVRDPSKDEVVSINEQLLSAGYAREYTYQKQIYRLQSLFKRREQEAHHQIRGLWSQCPSTERQ